MAQADRDVPGAEGPAAGDRTGDLTVELASPAARAQLPAVTSDLREFLPGLEPERQVTDWGRSERVEMAIDRTLYDFLYHQWFRVEAEGVENVPAEGGALLVANHAGALPPDGIMIAKAVREEHPRRRAVHLAVERSFKSVPGVGALVTKVGGVPLHPANLHRLLFDEGQLVLVFPEGRSGPEKPLKERYRMRPFHRGDLIAAAIRARVPIVPIALVGAEEAQPVISRLAALRRLTRLTRLPLLPLTPPLPLPAKFRVRFLEPVQTAELQAEAATDSARVQALAQDVRALIQENLLEMVAARRSVWLG
jgi:1-acyl-sn-glycerol-3-phosphate acyltransferase